jgi:MFS family permease
MTTSPRTVLLITSAAAFLSSLDLFIVNIAFPDIRADFPGTDLGDISWVLNGYTVVFAAFLALAGRLADRVGHRRVFLVGLAVFTAASIACAVAPSVGLLVAARAVQALGAALVTPTSLSLLLAAYPAERRGYAVGAWASIGAVAAALGPPLGGLLVEASWHWVFLVNVPVGLVALVAGFRVLPDNVVEGAGRPDVLVLDPPRAGLSAKVVRRIVEASPKRIVYVSCHPTTLAPNAAQLVEAGYALRRVRPVDMFPQTPHIECVALLERA